MRNCLDCFRLHRHEGVVFCPFLGLSECIFGAHYIPADCIKPKQVAAAAPPTIQESPAVKAVEQDNERNYNEFRELEKIQSISHLKCVLYTLGGNCMTKYLI